jgi:pimeloyl-ACP methyl ester carboxylesterase
LGVGNGNTVVMAFRGTDVPFNLQNLQETERFLGCIANLLTDGAYTLVHPPWIDDPTVLVHEGFLRDFEGLIDNLVNSIHLFQQTWNIQRIEVCGHSLGGALATLCALWCSIHFPGVAVTCLNLGSPRVGNAQFATAFRNQSARATFTCYRLFIQSDPIPKVPNSVTEALPIRYSPNARWWVERKQPGPQVWEHVGLEMSLNRVGASSLLGRAGEAVLVAAHSPWN